MNLLVSGVEGQTGLTLSFKVTRYIYNMFSHVQYDGNCVLSVFQDDSCCAILLFLSEGGSKDEVCFYPSP